MPLPWKERAKQAVRTPTLPSMATYGDARRASITTACLLQAVSQTSPKTTLQVSSQIVAQIVSPVGVDDAAAPQMRSASMGQWCDTTIQSLSLKQSIVPLLPTVLRIPDSGHKSHPGSPRQLLVL